MARISSECLVRALSRAGFKVFRRTPESTILERGLRAVAIRTRAEVGCEVLIDVRRMAGLSWQEMDAALAATSLAATPADERDDDDVSPMP
jgi:hypothetical protein